jgi:hypothetical protein
VTVVEEDDNEAADSYLSQLFFKTLCLLQDLNNMRIFISMTWSEYRDKKIDLMNAAVVTDSALQLARDLVQEVEADWHTSLTGERDIQNIVYSLAVFTRGISGSPSTEIGLPYNKNMADIAHWCYVPTKILLESFANVLQADHQPVFKKGYFGTYNPKADRERMSLGQKFNEDKIILLSILPEFCMVDTFKIQMPTEDAITRGLTEFAKTKGLLCGFASSPRSSSTFIISCDTVPWVHLETSECLDFAFRRLLMTTCNCQETLSPNFGQQRMTRRFKI